MKRDKLTTFSCKSGELTTFSFKNVIFASLIRNCPVCFFWFETVKIDTFSFKSSNLAISSFKKGRIATSSLKKWRGCYFFIQKSRHYHFYLDCHFLIWSCGTIIQKWARWARCFVIEKWWTCYFFNWKLLTLSFSFKTY